MTHLDEAYKFRKCMGQPIHTDCSDVVSLQLTLIDEEFDELTAAIATRAPRTHQLKELADLVFVCYQLAAAKGWDLDEALTRVYFSNMTKLVEGKPLLGENGKVLKGPHYLPPHLDDLI